MGGGGGGGGEDMPLGFTPAEESSVEQNSLQSSSSSSSSSPPGSFSFQRFQEKNEGGTMDGEFGSVYEGSRIPSSFLELQANQKKASTAYREVLQSYDQLKDRSKSLEEGKSKILSYTPGGWMENVIGMKLSDFDVPNTTVLLVIGPKGSGKSSLINRISKVFEDDKFASERAQVSYNSSAADGTYFLQEYMIPRSSTSFCLYDTRGLSYDSYDNANMLKNWITKGVHHRELIIRPSDNSHLRNHMKCKARGNGCQSKETRMVTFVIVVVDGLAVLKSMDNLVDEGKKYTQMIAKTFDCPYISFNDDKPVVVVTHGDLLSLNDRARVRVHLGELLGIPPAKQIFDIPESHDPVTELAIVNMLHYSLEHADKNLPHKRQIAKKVRSLSVSLYISLFFILAIAIISIYIPPLLILHPPIPKAHADLPQSDALEGISNSHFASLSLSIVFSFLSIEQWSSIPVLSLLLVAATKSSVPAENVNFWVPSACQLPVTLRKGLASLCIIFISARSKRLPLLQYNEVKMSGSNKSSGIPGGGDASKAPAIGAAVTGSVTVPEKEGTMKAPGQDARIPRDAFEKNPSGYFHDLHKK
ncbi:hypothetical protein D5086_005542 [Populus alba]|uniref:Uncharacterized protein n=1 Tax=Populus alba TaxID=43335 RepID=A0ACC4CUN9_POPAL